MSTRLHTARDLLLICAVSLGYEWLSLFVGLNEIDEGMPLYAAMQLHEGGTLYADVFFVFPPGHVLSAWLAYALDPPGVVLSRVFYSAFIVALCPVLYLLGRRFMPAGFALLGSLMVAILSPMSHLQHHLFGYRYLVLSAIALACFGRHVRTPDIRWMGAAGLFAALALCFRLTPAFAVVCGIGVGLVCIHRSWRAFLTDGAWFAAGTLLVLGPTLGILVFGLGIGPETLWREIVIRPMAMTALQSLPLPKLQWMGNQELWRLVPELTWEVQRFFTTAYFTAALFRIVPAIYLLYAVILLLDWLRARRAGAPFEHTFLLAFVVWGGVYFLRSLGRSDEPHLASALPPFCLIAAHLVSLPFGSARYRSWRTEVVRRYVCLAVGCLILASWAFVGASDRVLGSGYTAPVETLGGRVRARPGYVTTDTQVGWIQKLSSPGDTILILGPQCLLYVLSQRRGPGVADVVMPGTFRNEFEQQAFVEHLEAAPPTLVLIPQLAFDRNPKRSVQATAPQVVSWVRANYQQTQVRAGFFFYGPRPVRAGR